MSITGIYIQSWLLLKWYKMFLNVKQQCGKMRKQELLSQTVQLGIILLNAWPSNVVVTTTTNISIKEIVHSPSCCSNP